MSVKKNVNLQQIINLITILNVKIISILRTLISLHSYQKCLRFDKIIILHVYLHIDILAVQESRLDTSIFDKEVMIDDDLLFRNDHNCHGVGIVLYIASSLIPELQTSDIESLWLRSNPEKFLLDQYIDHHPLL